MLLRTVVPSCAYRRLREILVYQDLNEENPYNERFISPKMPAAPEGAPGFHLRSRYFTLMEAGVPVVSPLTVTVRG